MTMRGKAPADCGTCGKDIMTFFPKNPRCPDCAFDETKQRFIDDPAAARRFMKAVRA